MARFLVRRGTKEVFVWTEILAKNHADLEEVHANTAQEALTKKGMPDPRSISIEQLEDMNKADLIEFAALRLTGRDGKPLELDAKKKLGVLQDEVKIALFTSSRSGEVDNDVEEVIVGTKAEREAAEKLLAEKKGVGTAKGETRAISSPGAARRQAGV